MSLRCLGQAWPGCECLGPPGELPSWCAWAGLGEEATGPPSSPSGGWELAGVCFTLMYWGLTLPEQRKPRCAGQCHPQGTSSSLEGAQPSGYMSPLETTSGLIPRPPLTTTPARHADPQPQRSNSQRESERKVPAPACKDFLRPLWAAVASSDPRRRHMRKCCQMPDAIIPA